MNGTARGEPASPLLAIGTAGMLAAAVARAVAAMPPWKWFDVDPLRSPGAIAISTNCLLTGVML